MKISTAVFVIVLIFMMNGLLVASGLTNISILDHTRPLDRDTTPSNIIDLTTIPQTGIDYTEGGEGFTDNPAILRALPDASKGYDSYKFIRDNIGNLVWGYRNAFVLIGLPSILVYLLTGVIGFIQVLCLFTIIGNFISIFTGGGFR